MKTASFYSDPILTSTPKQKTFVFFVKCEKNECFFIGSIRSALLWLSSVCEQHIQDDADEQGDHKGERKQRRILSLGKGIEKNLENAAVW